jgi:hypothetical protein
MTPGISTAMRHETQRLSPDEPPLGRGASRSCYYLAGRWLTRRALCGTLLPAERQASVLLSTLSTIPGRNFEVRGLVFSQASLNSLGGGNVQKMVQEIIQQAGQFGADAIVDIKVVGSGSDHGTVVMTGTAVRLL